MGLGELKQSFHCRFVELSVHDDTTSSVIVTGHRYPTAAKRLWHPINILGRTAPRNSKRACALGATGPRLKSNGGASCYRSRALLRFQAPASYDEDAGKEQTIDLLHGIAPPSEFRDYFASSKIGSIFPPPAKTVKGVFAGAEQNVFMKVVEIWQRGPRAALLQSGNQRRGLLRALFRRVRRCGCGWPRRCG